MVYSLSVEGGIVVAVATEKMISYANAIAEKLNIELLNKNDFEYIRSFISNNKEKYQAVSQKEIDGFVYECIANNYKKLGYKLNYENLEFAYSLKKGIYIFWSGNELLYIGKSVNLKSRIVSSLRERNNAKHPITHVGYVELDNEADVHILEPLLITLYKPKLNTEFKCSDVSELFKSPILLENVKKFEIAERISSDG